MNANIRNRLAITVAALLLSSPAWAQSETGQSVDQAVHDTATQNAPERTPQVNKGATEQTEQMDHSTPPPSPPQSQGAEHAASHSSIVQRDLWSRLDTNGDGKISTAEGAVDTDFNAGFGTLDADKDGFVTDTEYRTAAKTDMETGSATGGMNASSPQSTSTMRDAMSRLDANADGSISLSESEGDATFRSNFSSIDANSDGLVSSAEYHAWAKAERKVTTAEVRQNNEGAIWRPRCLRSLAVHFHRDAATGSPCAVFATGHQRINAVGDTKGSDSAPVRVTAASTAGNNSAAPSTSTRMRPALISPSNFCRTGSGNDEPTKAEAKPPINVPATATSSAPVQLMPTDGKISTAIAPATKPAMPPNIMPRKCGRHKIAVRFLAPVGNMADFYVRPRDQRDVVVANPGVARGLDRGPRGDEIWGAENTSGFHHARSCVRPRTDVGIAPRGPPALGLSFAPQRLAMRDDEGSR